MLALLLLILWPIAELFVAIKVAEAIGVLLTVVLLLAGWPVGMWLTKAEGRAAWRRLTAAVTQPHPSRPPGREV
ncbi:MAG TPA: FxsA family protein, partial [Solirubrobacteraceae bacterium]|nr:FxsA family protein [Solirubrobacteraceae bacterium]